MNKALLGLLVCITCFIMSFTPAMAQGFGTDSSLNQEAQSFTGQIMTLSEDSKAYAAQDKNSEVVQSFTAGDTVFVVDTTDNWYQIFYKGETLYIPINSITEEDVEEAQKQAEEQAQAVSEELEKAEKVEMASIELLEKQRISQRNALIWKIVIVALVAAIIIVSAVIAISNMNNDKGDK